MNPHLDTPIRATTGSAARAPTTPCRDALRDVWPGLVGLAPFGLLVGVTIGRDGIGAWLGLGSAFGIFSGTGHLTALTLLTDGVAPLAVIGSVALGNARLLLYGAVLAPRFRGQPWWFRWLAPHLLIDLTHALVVAGPERTPRDFRRYWLTLGGAVTVLWIGTHATGMALGPVLPPHSPLEIAAPALFLGLLVPQLADRPAASAAGASAVVALATTAVAPGLALLAGGLAGLVAGVVVDRHAAVGGTA